MLAFGLAGVAAGPGMAGRGAAAFQPLKFSRSRFEGPLGGGVAKAPAIELRGPLAASEDAVAIGHGEDVIRGDYSTSERTDETLRPQRLLVEKAVHLSRKNADKRCGVVCHTG